MSSLLITISTVSAIACGSGETPATDGAGGASGGGLGNSPAASGGQGNVAGSGGGNALGGSGTPVVNPQGGGAGSPAVVHGGAGGNAGVAGTGSAGVANAGSGAQGNAGAENTGPCAAAHILLCDDFEATPVGAAPDATRFANASNEGNHGTFEIDGVSPAHSGAHSVYVNGNGVSTLFAVHGAPVFPLANNSVYVRTYIKVGTPIQPGHSTYIEAGPDNTNSQEEIRFGFHQLQLEVNRMPGDAEQLANANYHMDQVPGMQFDVGTWYCLELFFNGMDHELQVWVDDAELEDLHVIDWLRGDMAWSPTYEAIRFGYEQYSGGNAEVWYDDIAIGTARIGCQ